MTIYILLLSVTVFFLLLEAGLDDKQKQKTILLYVTFLILFLVYTLRSLSVGRDFSGYELLYRMAAQKSLFDVDYVYFESGYVLLQNLFSHAGLPFLVFLAFIDLVTLIPILMIVNRYSVRPIFSTLIFICYIYFEFNMTAIRQAMATSVCVLGFYAALESKRFGILWYILFILLAATIHRSALLCLIVLPCFFLSNLSMFIGMLLLVASVALGFRRQVLQFIGYLFHHTIRSSSIYFGWNYVFLLIMGLFFLLFMPHSNYSFLKSGKTGMKAGMYKLIRSTSDPEQRRVYVTCLMTEIYSVGLMVYLILGNDTVLRAAQYLLFPIWILIPNTIGSFRRRVRIVSYIAFVVFFIVFFAKNTLIDNSFDIVPYRFFWE